MNSSLEQTYAKSHNARRVVTPATEDAFSQTTRSGEHAQKGQDDPDGGDAPPAATHGSGPLEAATTSGGHMGQADRLRSAAQALLKAWDNRGGGHESFSDMTGPITALRDALGPKTSNGNPRPRLETKQAQVLAMPARDEGASGPQIAATMGWAPHTVRGFLAGLAKNGIDVEVLERVRQAVRTITRHPGVSLRRISRRS